ncbi:MAG: polysaccharide deacetylase family protein [Fimbriimonadaceae bacterium]|nr:polysaccharide deacetylase family protein [Fimbriimonadaceae bacterium]
MSDRSRVLVLLACGVAIGVGAVGGFLRLRHRLHWGPIETYELRDDILVHGNADLKEVALTFDDGPTDTTRDLLDVLKADQARATFFVVGKQVAKYPGLVRRMMDEGHEVGNHSFHHPRLDDLAQNQIRDEITACDRAVFQATGAHMSLFRPPGMRYDEVVLRATQDLGYVTVHWNVAAKDFTDQAPSVIRDRVLDHVQPGSVILLHGHPDTVRALPAILAGLRERGYRLVTVSQMLSRLPRPVYVKSNAYGATATVPTAAPATILAKKTSAKKGPRLARKSATVEPRSDVTPVHGLDVPTWN